MSACPCRSAQYSGVSPLLFLAFNTASKIVLSSVFACSISSSATSILSKIAARCSEVASLLDLDIPSAPLARSPFAMCVMSV